MNGAQVMMAVGAPCLCAQVAAARSLPGAVLTLRSRHECAGETGISASGSSSSSFGLWRVSRFGHVKPLKKTRRLQTQAAVKIDGKQLSNGPLRGSTEAPKETLMVDPLEAKRLAAVEWKLLQERIAFQKQRRIESINGGWALIGLTVGITVEAYTGKGILAQVAGYLDSLADYIASITPGTPVS